MPIAATAPRRNSDITDYPDRTDRSNRIAISVAPSRAGSFVARPYASGLYSQIPSIQLPTREEGLKAQGVIRVIRDGFIAGGARIYNHAPRSPTARHDLDLVSTRMLRQVGPPSALRNSERSISTGERPRARSAATVPENPVGITKPAPV